MFLRLFASDIDGTLLSHSSPEREKSARAQFFRLFTPRPTRTMLCYVTGRSLALTKEVITNAELPEPDALICDVGTSLYLKQDGLWTPDSGYKKFLLQCWEGKTQAQARAFLSEFSFLTLQEEEHQSEFKLSFYVDYHCDHNRLVQQVGDLLSHNEMESSIIFSRDPSKKRGLLDILPKGAAKLSALQHYMARFCLLPENVVYAGDSGNDLSAFCSGVRVIVVANTEKSVKDEVALWATKQAMEKEIYFSKKESIQGVLEGLCYHGLTLTKSKPSENC